MQEDVCHPTRIKTLETSHRRLPRNPRTTIPPHSTSTRNLGSLRRGVTATHSNRPCVPTASRPPSTHHPADEPHARRHKQQPPRVILARRTEPADGETSLDVPSTSSFHGVQRAGRLVSELGTYTRVRQIRGHDELAGIVPFHAPDEYCNPRGLRRHHGPVPRRRRVAYQHLNHSGACAA